MPEQKPQLDKFGVAAALQEIATLMDMRGGTYRFKAKAYNAGAAKRNTCQNGKFHGITASTGPSG